MPHQKKITRRLTLAYASAVIIITLLLLLSQVLIQLTLYREIATRTLASTMALQELRTQAIFRNGLLAALPKSAQDQFNTSSVAPINALAQNLSDVEATNKQLIGPSTPASVSAPIAALQGDFHQMDQAGHLLLTDLKAGKIKDAGNQLGVLFLHQQKYLLGTYNAYLVLTSQADSYVAIIRILEACICAISLLVLATEALAIIRPAIRDYKKALADLDQVEQEGKSQVESQATEGNGASTA